MSNETSTRNLTLEYLGQELMKIDSSLDSGQIAPTISLPSPQQLIDRAVQFLKENWPTILSSACSVWKNTDKQVRTETIDKMVRAVRERLPPPFNNETISSATVTRLIEQGIDRLCKDQPQNPPS